MAWWLPDASLGSAFNRLRNGVDGQEAQDNFVSAEGASCRHKRVPSCRCGAGWSRCPAGWLALLRTPRGAPPAEGAFGAPPLRCRMKPPLADPGGAQLCSVTTAEPRL